MKKKYIITFSLYLGIFFFILFLLFSKKNIYLDLMGNKNIIVNINTKYKEDGYKARVCNKYLNFLCLNLNNKVKVKENKYEDKLVIDYILKYNNSTKKLSRIINFKDIESPVIKLNKTIKICPNSSFIESGYSASDNVDGDITDNVIIEIKKDKVFYSVKDSSNNEKTVYRNIVYFDNENPVIKLNGNKNVYSYIGNEYKDNGFIAKDNCDGDITDNVKISSNINIKKVGNYKVNYSVNDSYGNKTSISRNVIVYDDISKIPKNGKVIYLTFDDGPCSYTEDILSVLDKYNVKATFFVTNQFSDYTYLIKKEFDSGHTVAVHTYSHVYKSIYSSLDNYVNDFNNMNQVIYNYTGTYSKLFRFPGGSSNTISKFKKGIISDISNYMTNNGYLYFDWNIDSTDTQYNDPDVIYNNTIKYFNKYDNSIVLMHDIKKANIESVDKIIKYGLENGYTFLPLTEESYTAHHKINN